MHIRGCVFNYLSMYLHTLFLACINICVGACMYEDKGYMTIVGRHGVYFFPKKVIRKPL